MSLRARLAKMSVNELQYSAANVTEYPEPRDADGRVVRGAASPLSAVAANTITHAPATRATRVASAARVVQWRPMITARADMAGHHSCGPVRAGESLRRRCPAEPASLASTMKSTTQPPGTTGFDVVGSWGWLRVEVPGGLVKPPENHKCGFAQF